MNAQILLFAAVFSPFVAALLAPLVATVLKARTGLLLALSFVPGLWLATLSGAAKSGNPAVANLEWVPGIDLALTFRADGYSLLFALVVSGIGTLIMLYASAYLGKGERYGRFYSYLLLFGGAMMGLVLTDNLVALFAFWELTSIASFLLIGYWDFRKASQDGAMKAMLITAIGGLALLVGVVLLSIAGGSGQLSELDLVAIQESPLFFPAALLLLLAAMTKSAQIPFHLWLPTAMEAPTPISAYLHSATMVKAGVLLVAKLGPFFVGTVFSTALLFIGLATMFWGSYLAIRQYDLKALLAYSTVSQLGILMALYGAGHPFAATAHLINHAAFKATLFMVVGIIDHETGSRDLRNLSGLMRKFPVVFALALPATLSMAGLPPFGGFISKELFYEEILHEGVLPMVIAVTGSMMTFAYSLRFLDVFWGELKMEKPDVHRPSVSFWLPVTPLVLGVLAFGLLPVTATWLTNLAAPSLGFEPHDLYLWHGFSLVLWLSVLTWAVGFAIYWFQKRFTSVQEALTPSWNVNTIYYASVRGLEGLSNFVTNHTQNTSFANHVRLIWIPFALAGLVLGWRFISADFLSQLNPVPLEFIVPSLLVLSGAGGLLVSRTRLSALIFMGLAGLSSAAIFVMLRAPDLALTQLLIETVTVILFLAVFRYLPQLTRYTRSKASTAFDTLLASSVGLTVFTTLVAVQTPIAERLKDWFLENSKKGGGGNNVVNVILVDFRGYDTMGEITVLAVVGVSVYALLKMKTAPIAEDASREEKGDEGG